RLGVQVETLTGDVIYSQEGDRFFVPASTLKLLTTAAVLTQLGPDYTISTPVYGITDAAGMTTLRILGQGDPSFEGEDLTTLATQLAQQNIREVDILYGDESAFPGSTVNPNWEWEDVQAGYGAPVNALILEENEIGLSLIPQGVGQPLQVAWDEPTQQSGWQIENNSTTVSAGEPEFVRVGRDLAEPILRVGGQLVVGSAPETASIAVPNPGEAFLVAFQSALALQNIPVQQMALSPIPIAPDWPELATVQSPSLAELLIPTNQNSNNLYAEALLKQLGRQSGTQEDATQMGITIALNRLRNLGVDTTAVVMVDGSGLARKNLITPAAMVDVLQVMARSPFAATYRQSLAVAGTSGTLRNRFQGTSVEGRLWGKSGAISRNFALAGYLEPQNYDPIAFSVFINNINQRGNVARQLIDDLVQSIAELRSCDGT
ncbi:MAG: D-alanyl-D-alanine carboxypeptidase/D-alanyl-D-alanine-endopeptidase, partial [Leptolyngbya sp. SIO1D8]|nr:D-alanyl-D-alanine carboxypeptidase/D-alanyl-D-alanine-endopeptidase [Leptolyngbya sp. SIO1D8]